MQCPAKEIYGETESGLLVTQGYGVGGWGVCGLVTEGHGVSLQVMKNGLKWTVEMFAHVCNYSKIH